MDQNNNFMIKKNDGYDGPKTLFLSGKFYYEPNKDSSSAAPSYDSVSCRVCSHQDAHLQNKSPTGSQSANESTVLPGCKMTYPCSPPIGIGLCRCCTRSSFAMQSSCCMHPSRDLRTSCCFHNCTKYACHCHFPAPCTQSFCGMDCSNGIKCQSRIQCHCRMQNPWGLQCNYGMHSPCWMQPSCGSLSDIQNKSQFISECQRSPAHNHEENSPRSSTSSGSLHTSGSSSPIDMQSSQCNNSQPCTVHQINQKLIQESSMSLKPTEPSLPLKLDFPNEHSKPATTLANPNRISVIEPSVLPSQASAEVAASSELLNHQTVQNKISQNTESLVIKGLPKNSLPEERIDNNLVEKQQTMVTKVQNERLKTKEIDKQPFADKKNFLPSTSSIAKSPQPTKSECENLDDLREKLQTVFQNQAEPTGPPSSIPTSMPSENGRHEVKSSKDFSRIDKKQSSSPHRPPTEQKPQQNGNAYKNFPGNNGLQLTEVKEIGTTSVPEVPPVRKCGFKILKVVEYVDPEIRKEMTPPAINTGRFQVSKVIENNVNETVNNSVVKNQFKGAPINENASKTQDVRDVPLPVIIGNRFKVTKVLEDPVNKPQAPLVHNDNRFSTGKVDSNEVQKREVQSPVSEDRCKIAKVDDEKGQPDKELPQARFYMCKIDQNANKPQMQVLQLPLVGSRFVNAKQRQSEKGNGEKIQSNFDFSSPPSKRNSSTEPPPLTQEYLNLLNMDEMVLFQELSVIMNEAQTWSSKLDNIESNDKLEKGAISHRAVEIKKNRTVWLNFMKLRQTLDPSYYEPTPKDYDCDMRVRLYEFLRKSYTEVHFKSFYLIAKLKEHENADRNSQFGISLRTDCIQNLFELRKKLDACEEALNF